MVKLGKMTAKSFQGSFKHTGQRWTPIEPASELLAQIVYVARALALDHCLCDLNGYDVLMVMMKNMLFTLTIMIKRMLMTIITMITAAMVVTPMMLVAGVSGEEDQRSGQRTALCHEGPEESYSERWKQAAEI